VTGLASDTERHATAARPTRVAGSDQQPLCGLDDPRHRWEYLTLQMRRIWITPVAATRANGRDIPASPMTAAISAESPNGP
jgi:hypothetical protein